MYVYNYVGYNARNWKSHSNSIWLVQWNLSQQWKEIWQNTTNVYFVISAESFLCVQFGIAV